MKRKFLKGSQWLECVGRTASPLGSKMAQAGGMAIFSCTSRVVGFPSSLEIVSLELHLQSSPSELSPSFGTLKISTRKSAHYQSVRILTPLTVCSIKRTDSTHAGRSTSIRGRSRPGRPPQRRHLPPDDTVSRATATALQLPRELELMLPRELELQSLPELAVLPTSTPLQWKEISPELLLGDDPRSLGDVHVIAGTGAKALIIMVDDEEDDSAGLDWEALSARATSLEIVTSRICMDRHSYQDQAMCLPEAVKIVTSLTATGHTVYLSDSDGTQRASLVTLGYLTFAKGMDLKEAMRYIIDVYPSADPPMAAWEEARGRLLSGHSRRVAQVAADLANERQTPGGPGSAAEDWLRAQRMVISEQFKRGVNTQVYLAEAMKQIAYLKGTKVNPWEMEMEEFKQSMARNASALDPAAAAATQLLVELGGLEHAPGALHQTDLLQQEATAKAAAEAVKARVTRLMTDVADAKQSEEDARAETETVKESMLKLKSRIDNLLKQVVSERATAAMAKKVSQTAQSEIATMSKQLESARKHEAQVRAESERQISALQLEVSGLHRELVSATERIVDLERAIEEERASAKDAINNIKLEATRGAEQQVERVAASLRMKIEAAAAQHRQELESARASYKVTLEAMNLSDDAKSTAIELSSAIQHSDTLSHELINAQDCMSQMADELHFLQSKVVEDKMGTVSSLVCFAGFFQKRETQIQEELDMLMTAQAHVDRMAAEKVNLLEQKILLQKVILVSIGLAVAGPLTIMAFMAGGPTIEQVSASEVIQGQQLVQANSVNKLEPRYDSGLGELNAELLKLGGIETSPFAAYSNQAPEIASAKVAGGAS